MVPIGLILKLFSRPEKVPELLCELMPGHAAALVKMEAAQRVALFATIEAFAYQRAVATAISEKRDLSEAEAAELAEANRETLIAAFELQDLNGHPVTMETLSRMVNRSRRSWSLTL